jgi:hypothetical protein
MSSLWHFVHISDKPQRNIGNAKVAGLMESLRMTEDQFSVALTVTLYETLTFLDIYELIIE